MTSKKPASEDDGPDSKEKLDKVVGKDKGTFFVYKNLLAHL